MMKGNIKMNDFQWSVIKVLCKYCYYFMCKELNKEPNPNYFGDFGQGYKDASILNEVLEGRKE